MSNPKKIIDLHTHTSASDGSLSPAELVAEADAAGLAAVAITDHDNIDGVAEALAAGAGREIEVVPGVEISMAGRPNGSIHLVGLFIDHTDPELNDALHRLQEARRERNPKIAKKLQDLGIAITMDEVRGLAEGEQVGRPHFAKALLKRGVVSNIPEAFNRFLGYGKPAYVDKKRFDPPEAIAMVLKAGGVPILAHPGMLKLGMAGLELLVLELMECGLTGIEVYYPEHDGAFTKKLQYLAARMQLVISGGTDFHGQYKKKISLGTGYGTLRIPVCVLEAIRARRPVEVNCIEQ